MFSAQDLFEVMTYFSLNLSSFIIMMLDLVLGDDVEPEKVSAELARHCH